MFRGGNSVVCGWSVNVVPTEQCYVGTHIGF